MGNRLASISGVVLVVAFIFLLSQNSHAQSVTTLDTVYTPPGYPEGPLTATVYMPAASNGVGVVLTHGYTANRQTLKLWCDTLAANGFVSMTIDYRDYSDTIRGLYPKPVRAHKIAVEFLRRNALRFGIRTGKIVGLGQSEGAFHWGEAITWDNDDSYFGTDPMIDDRIDAAILLYGIYDNYQYLQSGIPFNNILTKYFSLDSTLRSTKGNCLAHISAITTPILLLHGTADRTVQNQQSIEYDDSLVAYGKTVQLKLFSGQGHVFEFTTSTPTQFTSAGLIAKDTVLAFLRRTLQVTDVPDYGVEPFAREFMLSQNYPNPFNPETNIAFHIGPQSGGLVTMKIYDLLGREVATIVDEKLPPGEYIRKWNAGGASSGVYYCQMTAHNFTQTRKLVLMK